MAGFFSRLFGGISQNEIEARLLPIMQIAGADGTISPEEQMMLQMHFETLGISGERAMEILENATGPVLPTKEEHRIEVLLTAAGMMMCDGRVTPTEYKLFLTLARCMGFPQVCVDAAIENAIELANKLLPGVNIRAQLAAARANVHA